MWYAEFARRLLALTAVARVRQYGAVVEKGRDYPLFVIETSPAPDSTAARPAPGSRRGGRTLVITCGFHGDEVSGPLTVLERGRDIVTYARARGVALHIYPCINPSGFEARTRYNASGQRPNNDFLRYEVAPGLFKDDLGPDEGFTSIRPARPVPRETEALRADLDRLPTPQGALDIHQDAFIAGAFSYAYVFGDRGLYHPFVTSSAAHATVLRETRVDSGYHRIDGVRTDDHGLIVFHDGSVTDYFFRRGVPYTAALETTTQTPSARSAEINLIWIRGFVDLIADLPRTAAS